MPRAMRREFRLIRHFWDRDRNRKENIAMPYTIQDYQRDYVREHLDLLSPQEVLRRYTPEEVIKQFSPEEIQ